MSRAARIADLIVERAGLFALAIRLLDDVIIAIRHLLVPSRLIAGRPHPAFQPVFSVELCGSYFRTVRFLML